MLVRGIFFVVVQTIGRRNGAQLIRDKRRGMFGRLGVGEGGSRGGIGVVLAPGGGGGDGSRKRGVSLERLSARLSTA